MRASNSILQNQLGLSLLSNGGCIPIMYIIDVTFESHENRSRRLTRCTRSKSYLGDDFPRGVVMSLYENRSGRLARCTRSKSYLGDDFPRGVVMSLYENRPGRLARCTRSESNLGDHTTRDIQCVKNILVQNSETTINYYSRATKKKYFQRSRKTDKHMHWGSLFSCRSLSARTQDRSTSPPPRSYRYTSGFRYTSLTGDCGATCELRRRHRHHPADLPVWRLIRLDTPPPTLSRVISIYNIELL
ncbi:unnamed protein product [Trichogramma brassicae]|uniref:Uncharacterized protein n=1 Tax=Trichogramma brassicae TaxID=86971 RepID=A0A6H5IB48_9HYME|nr:unnamed protein product [Trichogramma brassicae]